MIDITQMKQGEIRKVSEIQGGYGLIKRLESLGIRTEVTITKRSSQFMRGPVVIQIGNTQIALGFGMAKKILVESATEAHK